MLELKENKVVNKTIPEDQMERINGQAQEIEKLNDKIFELEKNNIKLKNEVEY